MGVRMRPLIWLQATILMSTLMFGQTQTELKKGDRPVFMSAQRLALLCEDWGALHPNGRRPKDDEVLKVSDQQIVRSEACDAYILGVYDAQLEGLFPSGHYHPVGSQMDFMKLLIDTFLKYVKDHPEKQNFAASTLLL